MDLADPRVRYLSGAVVFLVVAGLSALLLLGPARGARQDLAEMESDVSAQLETVRAQLATLETQLEVTQALLATTGEQVELTRDMLPRIEEQRVLVGETVELQRQLLELTRAMLQEMREMNDKLPPPTGGGLVPAQ